MPFIWVLARSGFELKSPSPFATTINVTLQFRFLDDLSPVGWGCRISAEKYPLPTTSVLDVTLNHVMTSKAGALGNVECPFIAIAPRFTLPGVVTPDRVLSKGQKEKEL